MYDTVIIGSGPAGLSAAVYATRAQLSFVVVEKDYEGTGQIALSECVDNYLGLPEINGYELGERFRGHALSLGAQFVENTVTEIASQGSGWKIRFADGSSAETRTVIYAAGASHRKLGVAGEDEFIGKGVSYCAVCDGAFYRGKTVAVVGGGDTALTDALFLSKTAEKVYLVHRRDEFRANKALRDRVSGAENIEPVLSAVTTEIVGSGKVSGVKLAQNGEERTLAVDGVFVAVGILPATALLKGIVKLDSGGYVAADESTVTSAAGIFAAGDVRAKKLRQVATAVADGANSVTAVEEYLAGAGKI